jgi:cysteine-S-conjugate beta-lyase
MGYDFDTVIDRRASDSSKWHFYSEDVLPMWVADMDFRSPEPILRAMHERVDHGVFGYGGLTTQLREVICERMARLYHWTIQPEAVVSLPGLVCGLNVVSRAIGERGDGVLISAPVYPPFLSAPTNQERELQSALLDKTERNGHLYYSVDCERFEAAVRPNTRLFILCNPHNPIGRAYTPAELSQLAEICLRHDLVICSDEIHCDLLLGGTTHTPLAALAPELAERTITLMAPSKTFNVPGLGCSIAIIPNGELRRKVQKTSSGIVPHVNLMGYAAAVAAYSECEDWLAALQRYLTANRDFVVKYIRERLPQLRVTVPEATYLAWIDCRDSGIEGNPQKFFLEQAKVALNDGRGFGQGGEGFVRLNFGCPRSLLEQGLAAMHKALQ